MKRKKKKPTKPTLHMQELHSATEENSLYIGCVGTEES